LPPRARCVSRCLATVFRQEKRQQSADVICGRRGTYVLFNSWTFLVFFCCVSAAYRLLPGWTSQKRLLLAASYLFYAAWHPPYVVILATSTLVDWWIARRIWRCEGLLARKRLLLVSLVCNLCLLGFFKYGGFVLENLDALLSALRIVHARPA